MALTWDAISHITVGAFERAAKASAEVRKAMGFETTQEGVARPRYGVCISCKKEATDCDGHGICGRCRSPLEDRHERQCLPALYSAIARAVEELGEKIPDNPTDEERDRVILSALLTGARYKREAERGHD